VRAGTQPRDERGQAVSVFLCVVFAAMIMAAGLVVDGGQQIAAATRAEVAAAGAARVAADARATGALAGSSSVGAAVLAARNYLSGQPDVTGTVGVSNGVVTVDTATSEPTIFLAIIGIRSVSARGSAVAELIPSGGR
jgi:hypothetical protein